MRNGCQFNVTVSQVYELLYFLEKMAMSDICADIHEVHDLMSQA